MEALAVQNTELEAIIAMRPKDVGGLRRRAEEIEYWRQRAGWFNDDESMRDYNQGVYDTYYEIDDDGSGGSHHRTRLGTRKQKEIAKKVLSVLAIVVALSLLFVMLRALMRRLASSKRDKSSSDSRSRSGRSKSRSRSRSRTRKTGADYELMEEDGSRSKRSSRSKSRTRRSRSRSRQRSSSKTRPEKKREEESVIAEPILV